MRDHSDEQLRAAGWRWALRDLATDELLAVTVEPSDAAEWIDARRGAVIPLRPEKERK